MHTLLIIVHLLLAIAVIVLVLIQRGKGADIGAAFGSGASNTVFGSQGSASFLTRTTAVLAALFFITSITLGYFSTQSSAPKSVTETVAPSGSPAVPAAPVAPAEAPRPQDVPAVPSSTQ